MRKSKKNHKEFWTMKSGWKICICDMSDSHLENTIHLIERISSSMPVGSEDFCNGDTAFDTVECDPDEVSNGAYSCLVKERKRRKTFKKSNAHLEASLAKSRLDNIWSSPRGNWRRKRNKISKIIS